MHVVSANGLMATKGGGPRSSLLPGPWQKRLAAVCTVYLFVYSTVSPLLFPVLIVTSTINFLGIINLTAILTILFIFCFYRVKRRQVQRRINEAQAASLSEADPFALYLRPFVSGGRLLCRNTLESAGDRSILGRVWDAELNFAVALESWMPLVAIGDRSRGYGAAKLQLSDEAWQTEMRRLATHAALIITVPFNRPGTLWEVRQLFSDNRIRSKTLFFMPPMLRRPFHAWRRTRAHRPMWEDARHALKLEGISLPPYRRLGCFFMIGQDGSVLHTFPLADLSPVFVQDLMLAISHHLNMPFADNDAILRAALSQIALPKQKTFVRRLIVRYVSIGAMIWGTIAAVTFALSIRILAYEPFNMPSGSMMPTLRVGDYFFASKFSYGYSRFSLPLGLPLFSGRIFEFHHPERGDVVVFRLPTDTSVDYIKRIVGLPGDRVQMIHGNLILNGRAVPRRQIESYADQEAGQVVSMRQYVESLPRGAGEEPLEHRIFKIANGPLDNTPIYEVPADCYFVLGDNRDNSQDSRVMSAVGFVPAENLIGPGTTLFFSTNGLGGLSSVRYERLFTSIH